MKFCKDCQHCYKNPNNINAAYWKCQRIDDGYNPVTGNPYYPYCDDSRKSHVDCGPDGRNFQPKSGD